MARSTRGNSLDEAPSRALRSGSLGTGTRTNNGPGSRASARANQDGDPEELNDELIETMREQQADIRLSGSIAGYKNAAKLTRREKEFHELLVKDLKLSQDTADEIFRQGIDGFKVIEGLSESDINSIVVSMHENKVITRLVSS